MTETVRRFKEESGFMSGRRAGHDSKPGSPYSHSTILSPKSPVMKSQSARTQSQASPILTLWCPRACSSPEAGVPPTPLCPPGWNSPSKPAQTHGPFFSHPCAFKETGTPGVILTLSPLERPHRTLVLQTLTVLQDEFLPHRAPHSQWSAHVDATCPGVHSSLS